MNTVKRISSVAILICTYDRAGNRDGREEQYRDAVSGSIHTAVTSYAYDSMGRLTGETLDGETACYSYDHAGNRLTRTGAGRTEHYRYNSRNQLTELDSTAGTVRYEYDPAGSLTAEVHTAQGGSAAERIPVTHMMCITGTPPYAVQVMCRRTIMMRKGSGMQSRRTGRQRTSCTGTACL